TWRAEEGPYLMLPLLGPSNPRDLFGRVVDTVTDPFTWVLPDGAGTARTATGILDTREALIDPIDTVRREALDPYAQIRSLYRQRRNAEIENRTPPRGP
ncbi:MAG: VacJ family lipoprotein, partial [Alphaproteobacteria bacterium]|nr:VacJ family lipoprotein [Alphaproteobacteria bacterium]